MLDAQSSAVAAQIPADELQAAFASARIILDRIDQMKQSAAITAPVSQIPDTRHRRIPLGMWVTRQTQRKRQRVYGRFQRYYRTGQL